MVNPNLMQGNNPRMVLAQKRPGNMQGIQQPMNPNIQQSAVNQALIGQQPQQQQQQNPQQQQQQQQNAVPPPPYPEPPPPYPGQTQVTKHFFTRQLRLSGCSFNYLKKPTTYWKRATINEPFLFFDSKLHAFKLIVLISILSNFVLLIAKSFMIIRLKTNLITQSNSI
jgi:hypothetical protein